MLPAFSLIVPAYNEAHRIGDTLIEAVSYLTAASSGSEIIVVDDGSTDATADVVRDVFKSAGGLESRLIQQTPNRGKGAAVRAGLRAASRPIAWFSDADLSTPIEEASKLIEPISVNQAEVTFGSRALDRRLIGTRQSWGREQGGRVFNLLVRLSTGLPFWDTQCGFKAFKLDAFQPVLAKAHSDGFGFDVELLYLAHRAGLRMQEIPVRWNHCEGSKVHFVHDSLHMLQEVIAMRMRR